MRSCFVLELNENNKRKYAYNMLWADDDDDVDICVMCTKSKWVSKYRASRCYLVHGVQCTLCTVYAAQQRLICVAFSVYWRCHLKFKRFFTYYHVSLSYFPLRFNVVCARVCVRERARAICWFVIVVGTCVEPIRWIVGCVYFICTSVENCFIFDGAFYVFYLFFFFLYKNFRIQPAYS